MLGRSLPAAVSEQLDGMLIDLCSDNEGTVAPQHGGIASIDLDLDQDISGLPLDTATEPSHENDGLEAGFPMGGVDEQRSSGNPLAVCQHCTASPDNCWPSTLMQEQGY